MESAEGTPSRAIRAPGESRGATTPVRVALLSDRRALAAHGPALDELAERHHAPGSMRGSSLAAWWRHGGGSPLLAVLHQGEALVAAAPLTLHRRFGSARLSGTGATGEAYAWLGDEAARVRLADELPALLDRRHHGWRLTLSDLRDEAVLQTLIVDPHLTSCSLHALVPQLDVAPGSRPTGAGRPLEARWDTEPPVARGRRSGRALAEAILRGHAEAGRLEVLRSAGEELAVCVRSGPTVVVRTPDPGRTYAEVVRHFRLDPRVRTVEWSAGTPLDQVPGAVGATAYTLTLTSALGA